MDEKIFEKIIEQLGELTPSQFKSLVIAYAEKSQQNVNQLWDTAVFTIAEQHLLKAGVNSCCPECGSISIVNNGKRANSGIQRFLCKDCNNHFTLFSGTLLEKSRYPWSVWVEILRMTLNYDSIETMKIRLENDFDCDGITLDTIFYMRLRLIFAMAAMPTPILSGIIQVDETVLYESQKGRRDELVSYIVGEERKARRGRCPSKYGSLSPEFATILTAADNRGYCVCKFIGLGRATVEHVADLFEEHCYIPAYLCSDANSIYSKYCEVADIPHYVKSSKYNENINQAINGKPAEEKNKIMAQLYKDGLIDKIENREDLSYAEFLKIKKMHGLNLARVNELHSDLKFAFERKMTNVASKYLGAYVGFFTYRRNWKVQHGHYPISSADAESILEQLIILKGIPTKDELKSMDLDLPRTTGRFVQLLKGKTEQARIHTANKYFKFDAEDLPSFNKREILLDAPRIRLSEIAKTYKIKGYTKMSDWTLVSNILKLSNIEEIVIDLLTSNKKYMISDEDAKYLQSMKYRKKD